MHPPNVDALKWCRESLWSKIRERLPEAKLHTYGAYTTKYAKEFHCPELGIYVNGPVDDLSLLFKKYLINFAPLRYGAGIKGKITDGWYYNIPCITTRIGAEGLYSEDFPFGGIIANSEEEIVDAVEKLYYNNALWSECVSNGNQLLVNKFSMKAGEDFIESLLNRVSRKDELRKNNVVGSILQYNTNRSTEYFSRFIGKFVYFY